MAATAVAYTVVRIPEGGAQGGDNVAATGVNATTAGFSLRGGKYGVSVVGATFGTVTLQTLGPDGATWLTAMTAFAASGYAVGDLTPGQYRFALA